MNDRHASGTRSTGKPVKRKTGNHPAKKLQPVPPELIAEDSDSGEIVARPDGYHWIAPDGRQEFGPFETLELAQAYRDGDDAGAPEPAETVQEVEAEIGMSDWIDPETGEPAEGPCPPHLEDE
jgi:hypothetical protein